MNLDHALEATATVRLVVNGEAVEDTVPVRLSLADFLRDHLRLTGTHLGCEHGVCGCCNVLLDGRDVRSCLMLAVQAEGATVTTVEGLRDQDGGPGDVQRAFLDAHALQCGYCTPAMVVSTTRLLNDDPDASEGQVEEALSGNICRCTGYGQIREAVRAAQAGRRASEAVQP